MEAEQGAFAKVLKQILFRPIIKHRHFQRLWSRLHTMAIFGMNYGGGGLIETSGEMWVVSQAVVAACKEIVSPVVFDVGANVGDYSLFVKRHLPAAQIYAFEPARATYQQLEKHIVEAGGQGNIGPYNIGFSDAEKTVELYSYTIEGQEVSLLSSIDLRRPTQVVAVRTSLSERIQVKTIDRFCETEEIARIDFLKLDVEGHELAVLRGAQRMLTERRVTMIQFEFGPANIYSRTFFYDFWTQLSAGYDIYRIVPDGIVPLRYYGEHLEIFLTTNYLAIQK
ncbi:MAG: FkbM family methyltransferase [Acidobacteriota bacterium]